MTLIVFVSMTCVIGFVSYLKNHRKQITEREERNDDQDNRARQADNMVKYGRLEPIDENAEQQQQQQNEQQEEA